MKLDFLKKIKKREIIVFAIVACIVVFAGYYRFFLSPVISKALSVFREASKLQSRLDKAELSINRRSTLRSEIEELKSKANLYSHKLPKEEEFPAVLESLSAMALNSGVKITKILPLKKSIPEDSSHAGIYSQQEISITAQCGYNQLGMFIAELENTERFMEVSDIRIEAGRMNPKKHNVQLVVKTFILKGE